MLTARIPAHNGQPEKTITADDPLLTKQDFYELAARGVLQCSGTGKDGKPCCAPVTHVSGGFVDGGITSRVPHFRSDDIERHAAGCENLDDPRDAKRTLSIRRALDLGQPVLVNINIGHMGVKNGAKLAAPEFNANVNAAGSDLWTKPVWLRETAKNLGVAEADIVKVPARDVTDVLYYLELAKQHGLQKGGEAGAQAALRQLWFNTGHMVQSCSRFVVKDSTRHLGGLVKKFMDRASATPKRRDELFETPRLFLFEASNAQIEKAKKEATNTLYGQQFDMPVPTEEKPQQVQRVILGMRMKTEELDNQRVLAAGRSLWAIAVPTFSRRRAYEIKNKAAGTAKENVGPGFMFLQISNAAQLVSTDAPRHKVAAPRKGCNPA